MPLLMASTQSIVSLIVLVLVAHFWYNWSRLKSAPGPLLAGVSNLWRVYYQYTGKLRLKLVQLHDKNGAVVRYGVNSVSIRDPEAVRIIYSSRTGFINHDSYLVIMGISNGKDVESLVTIQDPVKHDRLRRSVAGAFSQTGVLELEDGMDETLSTLLEVVEIHKEIDLSTQLLWFSVDTAGRIAFSEDFGSLKTNSDHSGIIKVIHSRFMHWGNWAAMPGLERLLFHNPLSLRLLGQPSSIAVAAATKLQARLSIKESRAKHDLMQKFIEAGKTNPVILDTQGKVGMVMSTMSGAADTTATTMSAMIYYLLQNPPTMEKLLSELRLANLTTPIPKFSETRALPYLHAVTKEAMRLFPIFNIPMERTVPPGGVVLAGTFFPEGTCVGCLPSAVHRDRSIFGEDVDAFRPERWLDRDADAMRKMESIHLGFSRGKRVCLGQHIAIMQLKKVVPALLLRFKMSLVHPDRELEADFSPAIVFLKPLYVRIESKTK